tara:strand:+ start:189 stop:674 length:486 start_codon:yes stop_codon:yes gene_type:complete
MTPYEFTTSKRGRVLEALRLLMASITVANGYWTDVQVARTYSAHKTVLGSAMPAVCVLPTADNRTEARICAEDEYRMTVEIIGAVRVAGESDSWKEQAHKFAGDVQQALSSDRQLGGLVVFMEAEGLEIADADTSGGMATLSGFALATTIVYRVAVADVSA